MYGPSSNPYGAIVDVVIPGQTPPVSSQTYTPGGMEIKNGYAGTVNVTVRMNDPGQLNDNFQNPSNPMRASLLDFS